MICGNGIAEIEEKKIVGMDLWQWHCRKRREKKLLQWICGNGIAKIEGKKNLWEWIWQWHCQNRRGKKIVAIDLPNIGGEREV